MEIGLFRMTEGTNRVWMAAQTGKWLSENMKTAFDSIFHNIKQYICWSERACEYISSLY